MFDSRADTFFGGIEDLQNRIFQSLDNFAIRIKDLRDI
jgi:hypothetical protein